MRSVGITLAILMLAFSAFNGFREGPNLWGDAVDTRQSVVAFGQIVSAASAVLALVGIWRRQKWTLAVASVWALATIMVASVAGSVGGVGAALLAGLAAAVVVSWVVWFAWYLERTRQQ